MFAGDPKLIRRPGDQDVVGHLEAELERARAEKARLEGLLECITDGFLTLDRDRRVTYINAEAARLLQRPRDEILGREVLEAFPEAIGTPFEEQCKRAMQSGASASFEARYPPMGAAFEVRVYPGPEGLSIYFRDVTARKRAELEFERLYASERTAREAVERAATRLTRLQAITAALADAGSRTEVAAAVLAQALAALGASAGAFYAITESGRELELLGTRAASGGAPRAEGRLLVHQNTPLGDAVRSGAPVLLASRAELVARYPSFAARGRDEEAAAYVPLLLRARPVGVLELSFAAPRALDPEDHAFVNALGRQCAQALERARLHEAQEHAREHAEAANRAKDEFLSVLSHELRTPLMAMLGWARLLQSQPLDPGSLARGLETIERNARTQAQLIEDMLDITRIVTGKLRLCPREVDVGALVRGAALAAGPSAAAKGIELVTSIDPDVHTITGDPERLQQIAGNLLSNAVKFTPPGGRVEVVLTQLEGAVELRVSDTGQGIDAAFLPHVFERFRQGETGSSRAHGGLGLGLAIVKHLVELHRGTIAAASAGPGKGSTFTVWLPMCEIELASSSGDATPPEREGPPPVPARLDGVRVLVVDDDADGRELIALVLRQQGADVTLAGSASEALALFERAPIDVLISDIGLPGEDGYRFLARVRASPDERVARVPAIALTAYASNEDARKAYRAGFQLHVSKPAAPDLLINAVAKLGRRK